MFATETPMINIKHTKFYVLDTYIDTSKGLFILLRRRLLPRPQKSYTEVTKQLETSDKGNIKGHGKGIKGQEEKILGNKNV